MALKPVFIGVIIVAVIVASMLYSLFVFNNPLKPGYSTTSTPWTSSLPVISSPIGVSTSTPLDTTIPMNITYNVGGEKTGLGLARVEDRSTLLALINLNKEIRSLLNNLYGYAPVVADLLMPLAETLKSRVVTLEAQVTTAYSPEQGGTGEAFYSKTNVLVEGVDELDIVKNNGKYIYYIINPFEIREAILVYQPDMYKNIQYNTTLYIIKAYPPNAMSVVAYAQFKDLYIYGLYVVGDRIVLIGSRLNQYPVIANKGVVISPVYRPQTYVLVLEFDGRNIVIENTTIIDGRYIDSRLYNGVVYVVTSLPTMIGYSKPILPTINGIEIPSDKYIVLYDELPDQYTIIYRFNTTSLEYNTTVFVHGSTSRIYATYTHLYLISRTPDYRILLKNLVDSIQDEELKNMLKEVIESNEPLPLKIYKILDIVNKYVVENERIEVIVNGKTVSIPVKPGVSGVILRPQIYRPWSNTTIYSFEYEGLKLKYIGDVTLEGRLTDPYSISEYNGTLRVAVHVDRTDDNAVYVINLTNMEIIGFVKGIGKRLDIYAARFIGDKCYLITYRRKDPLVVVDLSNPRKPVVLGLLVMPGYSEYLHPLGKNVLLGIGRTDDNKYIKIETYNVSDPLNPTIISKILIGKDIDDARYVYMNSPVLGDYKRFIINTRDKYILIPVYTYHKDYKKVLNGIYVIEYDDDGVIELKGVIKLDIPVHSAFINDTIYAIGYNRVVAVHYENLNILGVVELLIHR